MQTCRHEKDQKSEGKKTKKAKGTTPLVSKNTTTTRLLAAGSFYYAGVCPQPTGHCPHLGLNPGPWNYSAALLPTELCQVLVTVQHLRVYGIVKKKKILIVLHQRGEAVRKSGSVKNCGKIAENCGNLRKIAENCEKLRKIAKNCGPQSPPPPAREWHWGKDGTACGCCSGEHWEGVWGAPLSMVRLPPKTKSDQRAAWGLGGGFWVGALFLSLFSLCMQTTLTTSSVSQSLRLALFLTSAPA